MANNNLEIVDSSPTTLLASIKGWETISRKDQLFIEKETRAMGESLANMGRSRLQLGEQLTNVQTRCPHGWFSRYIKAYHFKRQWVYDTIKAYGNATQNLPDFILRRAMARNMPILGIKEESPLGIYTKYAKRIPPPAGTKDPIKNLALADGYLDDIEDARIKDKSANRKKVRENQMDPEPAKRKCFNLILNFMGKLPTTGENRKDRAAQRAWFDDVVGMVWAEIGISSARTIEPQAAPEGFRAVVGRPRKEEAAA